LAQCFVKVLEYRSWASRVWCVFANPTLPEKPYFFTLPLAKVLDLKVREQLHCEPSAVQLLTETRKLLLHEYYGRDVFPCDQDLLWHYSV